MTPKYRRKDNPGPLRRHQVDMDVAKNMEKLTVFCSSKSDKKIMMDTLANSSQKNMKEQESEKIGPYPPSTKETLEINGRRTPHSKFFPSNICKQVCCTHIPPETTEKCYTSFLIKNKEQQTPKETEVIRQNASMVTKETFPLKLRQTTERFLKWSILSVVNREKIRKYPLKLRWIRYTCYAVHND